MAMPKEDDADFLLKLELRSPVGLPEQNIHTLILRKPRAGDVVRIGMPVRRNVFAPIGDFEIIGDVMVQMMATLAGLPPPSIGMMDGMDFSFAANMIAASFLPLSKAGEEALSST